MRLSSTMTRIMRFFSAGGLGVLAYYLVLYILTDLIGIKYLISAIIATIVNFSLSFILQKFWTFKSKGFKDIRQQIGKYSIMVAFIFVTNLVLLYILVEHAHLWYLLAQLLVTAFLSVMSYVFSRSIFTSP